MIKVAICMKLFGKTRREIKLQKVGEKDLAINSHWEIKWQMVFGAIKCIVLQMEKIILILNTQ